MTATGRIARPFGAAAAFSARRPKLVLALALLAVVLAAGALWRLPFTSDASQMIPSSTPELGLVREMMEAFRLGGDADVVARGDPAARAAFAAAFREELAGSPLVDEVITTYAEQYRISDDPLFIARMLMNLPPSGVERLIHYSTPDGLREVVAAWRKDRGRIPAGALEDEPVLLQRFVADTVLEQAAPVWLTDRPRTSKDGEWLHITVTGTRPAADVAFSRRIAAEVGAAVARAKERAPGIRETIVAGGYPAAVANQRSVQRDIVQTLVISGVLVLALFLVGFRQAGSLLHVGLPLAASVVCTFGLCTVLLGRMYLGSAVFACILVGLGIDYPIHLYNQMAVELRGGRDWREALVSAARIVGPGATGAALTTIAAFSLFLFLPFRPLVELGAIAASGLAICVLVTFTVLPALLALGDGRAARKIARVPMRHLLLPRIVRFATARARMVCAGAALLIAAAAALFFFSGRPGIPFTFEMGKFAPASPAYHADRLRVEQLFPAAARPSLVVAWHAATRREAFARGIELRRILEPLRGSLIADYYTPLRLFRTTDVYRKNLAAARAAILPAPLVERFDAAVRQAGEDPAPFESSRRFLAALKGALADPRLDDQLGDLDAPMWSSSIVPSGEGFVGVIPLAIDPLEQNPSDLGRIVAELEGKLAKLPGRWASVSGWLILERQIVGLLRQDLAWTMLIGAAAVALIAFALFRRIGATALALTPVAFGLAMTLGMMKLARIDFNYLTVAAFPIIVGTGIDNGIHLVHRCLREGFGAVERVFTMTGRAVLLTTLTTVSAFGSFVTSWNPGLREFGWTFNTGLIAALVASIVLLPALVALSPRGRGTASPPPPPR